MHNSGCFTNFLLLLTFLITISNYFTFNKLALKLFRQDKEAPKDSLQIYNQQNIKLMRKSALIGAEKNRKELLEASKGNDSNLFYSKVKMEAFCEKKERIGELGDGGKFVCNPKAARKLCTLLSLGLNNQILFDQHIFNATGGKCTILGADKDPQNSLTQQKYSAMNGQLFYGQIPEELEISKILEKSGLSEVEMMKIDIEEGEFKAVEPFIKEFFVCQIFIEVHGTPARHLHMLQILARYGFRLFVLEPNIYCENCCEYSLINELCMAQYGVVPLAINVPVN